MDEALIKKAKNALLLVKIVFSILFVVFVGMIYYENDSEKGKTNQETALITDAEPKQDPNLIVDGIHVRTGLIDAEGVMMVVYNCTNCHSAKLVTQNRMNTTRWNETIKWMQETQGLWDLGENQEVIVNYLVTNYPPKKSNGRRATLTNIEWYDLED